MPSTVASRPVRPAVAETPAVPSRPIARLVRGRRLPLATAVLTAATVIASLVAASGSGEPRLGAFDSRGLLIGLFTVDDPLVLAVVVVLLVGVGTAAERVMGARRTLLAYVGGGLVTSMIGLAIGALETSFAAAIPLNSPPTAGAPPIAAILVVAVTASCFTGVLWRRRIRLASLFVAVTLFLYAASASDLYSLVALPVGLVAGALLGGGRATLHVERSSHHETRVLLAAVTAVTAIGPVVATLWGSGAGLLSVYGWLSYDPLVLADGQVCVPGSTSLACPDASTYAELQAHAGWIAALPLVVLLVAAWGILRGRRGAVGLAIAVNLLVFAGMTYVFVATEPETLTALATVRDADVVSFVWQSLVGSAVGAAVPLIVAIVLFVFRRAARVPSAPGARRAFAVTVGVAALVTLSVSLVATLTLSDEFRPWPTLEMAVRGLPLRLLPPSLLPTEAVLFVPVTGLAQAAWYLPSAIFWTVCVIASVRLMVCSRAVERIEDRARVRDVLTRGGGGSLSFMTTWAGNAYWFAPHADAAIAYRVHGRIAVTLGGAVGADRHRPDVAKDFVDFCGENGWTPVFYSVGDDDVSALDALGWRKTQVAEEAVLDPTTWTPAGKKRQDIRTATNRAEREGVRTEWTSWAALSFLDRGQLRDISEAWVADKTIPEMEFTLGGVDQMTDAAVRLMLARSADGRIVAVTSWLPVYDEGEIRGYTLDVMRRRHDAMNGVVEFVIGAVVETLRGEGMTMVSLSGSPLAHHAERDDHDAVDRFLELLSTLLEPAYGFRSLATFKKKFQPVFAPVWMVFPDPAILPAAGLALMRCYVPGLTLARAARLAARLRGGSRAARAEKTTAVPA